MLECVANISEGRDRDILDALARACAPALLDVHTDPDHHRSVFTIASADPDVTQAAARALAAAAAEMLSLTDHQGVHPRLGAVDVVPFVALAPTPVSVSVDAARAFADWIGRELAVPSFLYDLADPRHRTLPAVRRDAFTRRASDFGPATPHPRLGTSAVGARTALVAINVELDDANVDLARAVARQVRERDGGLAGVRALGLALPSLGRAQVSMNLVDLDSTGIEAACIAVRERVEALGGRVRRVELVGLVPASALEPVSRAFLVWSGLSSTGTVEARAGAGTAVPDASDADAATPDAGPGQPA